MYIPIFAITDQYTIDGIEELTRKLYLLFTNLHKKSLQYKILNISHKLNEVIGMRSFMEIYC